MTPMDASKLTGQLVAAWPNAPWTDDTAELWMGELEHWPLKVALPAVRKVIQSCGFRPSIAEFREVAQGIARNAPKRGELEPAAEDKPCTPERNAYWLGEARKVLATMHSPMADSLRENGDQPSTTPRAPDKPICPMCKQPAERTGMSAWWRCTTGHFHTAGQLESAVDQPMDSAA